MRHQRDAITSLVVAFIFMALAPVASADEGSGKIDLYDTYRSGAVQTDDSDLRAFDPPEDEMGGRQAQQEEPGVQNYDFRRTRVQKGKTVIFGYTYSELIVGGGLTDTFSEGDEVDIASAFFYAQGGIRFLTINPSRGSTMQLGVRAGYEYAAFESGSYEGDKQGVHGMLELAWLDTAPKPIGAATFRFGGWYDTESGDSRVSTYELDYQDSYGIRGEIILEEYLTSIPTGVEYRVWRNQIIKPAWFHAGQLIARANIQLGEDREENFPGPETDNTSFELLGVMYIYKGVQPNGEWAVGALFGARWYKAAGYNSVDSGDTVTALEYGAVARFQLWKHLMLNVNGVVLQELDTGRVSGSIGANLTLFHW